MIEGSCPSCAGKIKFVSKVSLYAVCPFCANTLVRKDLNIELLGSKAELHEDGSPIQLYTTGVFKGRAFTVLGRIQVEFPFGYWNEWYIHFNDEKDGWLGEAQGLYCVTVLTKAIQELPLLNAMQPGRAFSINGENFIVQDVEDATCIGGEGELPFSFEGGYKAPVVDLATVGRRMATVDYSEEPPILFTGEYAEFDELQFGNYKKFEGW